MWLIIGAALLAFVLGAGLVLVIGIHADKTDYRNEFWGGLAEAVTIVFILAVAVAAGLVSAILTVIGLLFAPPYESIYLRALLVIFCAVLLVLGSISLVWWFRQIVKDWQQEVEDRREYREENAWEAARLKEEEFLAVYAHYVDAIRSGNAVRTRALLLMGMPFIDTKQCFGSRFDPRWSRVVFLLRRQDDPQNPLFQFTPLELAAHLGNPELVELLIHYAPNDIERNHWHTKAIQAAETARQSADPEAHPRYNQIIQRLKESMNPS